MQTLFRPEALAARRARLQGEVQVIVPTGWHLAGALLVAIVVAAGAYLIAGSYARIEMVTGRLVPVSGAAAMLPARAGIVGAVHVREGQLVDAGTRLADVRSEDATRTGATPGDLILAALADQRARLAAREAATDRAAAADVDRLRAQIGGADAELAGIAEQMSTVEQMVAVADEGLDAYRAATVRGFVSRRDLQQREDLRLTRIQQLAVLRQQRARLVSEREQARRALAQAMAQREAQAEGALAERAALAQRQAEIEAGTGFTITAPIAGRVTGLTAKPGQPANPQRPLMTIVPAGAALEAQLLVPTRAIGFVAPGQEVRLAIEAFPYQRFGMVAAQVVSVSEAAVAEIKTATAAEPAYLVTARLLDQRLTAFGTSHKLTADMALTARVVTEKRSLFEWLWEPIFGVARR